MKSITLSRNREFKKVRVSLDRVYHGIRLKDPGALKSGLRLWDAKRCIEEVDRAFDYFERKGYIHPSADVNEMRMRAHQECNLRFSEKGIHVTFIEDEACKWAERNPEITWVWLEGLLEDNGIPPEKAREEIQEYLSRRYGDPYEVVIDFNKVKGNLPEIAQRYPLRAAGGGVNLFIPMDTISPDAVLGVRRCHT